MEVTLDVGEAGNAPERVTVLTQRGQGYVHASFVEKQKSCTQLCGPDRPHTCHFVAVYRAKIAGPVGRVFAALPYLTQISRQEVVDTIQHPSRLPRHLRAHVGKTEFTPIYPQDLTLKLEGWDFDTDSLAFAFRSGQAALPWQSANVPGCGIFGQDRFLSISCGKNLSLLFEDTTLLLVSFADYGEAATKVLMGFEHEGKRKYLVRIGLKAQQTVGLLEPADTGGWLLRLRPADYALLC